MGWLCSTTPSSKQRYVDDLLLRIIDPKHDLLLAHSLRGNHLWILVRTSSGIPVIGLLLLRCSEGCWGYKDMCEADGPSYYDCPLSFLDRAPEPNFCWIDGHAGVPRTTWRDHVREFHKAQAERRRSRPRVGDEIVLPEDRFPGHGGTYRVTADLGRKGIQLNGYIRMKNYQLKWPARKTPANAA
jgi:hypothetical protein